MSLWSRWSNLVDMGFGRNAPAIWLYTDKKEELEVTLTFQGHGFMTLSIPPYNTAWRITVDPSRPFGKYSETYQPGGSYAYLDYDGFRDGPFQKTHGWLVPKDKLIEWQSEMLASLGFHRNEIDDANYSYARLLLERDYKEKYFAVYPQDQSIVDHSVKVSVNHKLDAEYRLWLYFVPVEKDHQIGPMTTQLKQVVRKGRHLVELGFLSDHEIAPAHQSKVPTPRHGHHVLHGMRGASRE